MHAIFLTVLRSPHLFATHSFLNAMRTRLCRCAVLTSFVTQSILTLHLLQHPYDLLHVADCYWWHNLHADILITLLSSSVDWNRDI